MCYENRAYATATLCQYWPGRRRRWPGAGPALARLWPSSVGLSLFCIHPCRNSLAGVHTDIVTDRALGVLTLCVSHFGSRSAPRDPNCQFAAASTLLAAARRRTEAMDEHRPLAGGDGHEVTTLSRRMTSQRKRKTKGGDENENTEEGTTAGLHDEVLHPNTCQSTRRAMNGDPNEPWKF